MTPAQVIAYYITGYRFYKETKMSHATLINWQRSGVVPLESQLKIQSLTKGKLKVDEKYIKELSGEYTEFD